MSLPTLKVEMDSGSLTSAAGGFILDDTTFGKLDTAFLGAGEPSWDFDISSYVRSGSTERGTSNELQRVEAGTGSILLDTRDGAFIPTNTLSPFYPNIVPMRRIRITATWNGVSYPIMVGHVEEWPVSFPGGVDQVVEIQLTDAFAVLAISAVSGSFPAQTTGERVTAILDAIEWPLPQRDIDTGASSVPASTLANVPALAHLQDVEKAEGGRLFISSDGKVTFRDRYPTLVTDFSTRTWSDTGSDMTYRDIAIRYGAAFLFNDIHMTRAGGAEQTAFSDSSFQRFMLRSFPPGGGIDEVLLASDLEVDGLADEYLARYSEPRLRIEGLLDNAMRHSLWDRVLPREIQDQIRVVKTPTGSDTISQDSQIEGIGHSWGEGMHSVSFRVSPSNATEQWILDDTTFSVLDSTTILVR